MRTSRTLHKELPGTVDLYPYGAMPDQGIECAGVRVGGTRAQSSDWMMTRRPHLIETPGTAAAAVCLFFFFFSFS